MSSLTHARWSARVSRRHFLQGLGGAAVLVSCASDGNAADAAEELGNELTRIFDEPVLRLDGLDRPVKVKSLELLRRGKHFLLRGRSADGVESVTVPNPARMAQTWPIVVNNILPAFIGQDARRLESLLWDVYRRGSNYKLQGIALWTGVAAAEMNLLELLGRTAQCPVAEFFGGQLRRDIAVYSASGNRGNRPEEEVEHLQKLIADSGARALKFRLGGRMSRNEDSLPGRSEALIPLVRKAFGDEFTLYAEANSSYDAREGIRIGLLRGAWLRIL